MTTKTRALTAWDTAAIEQSVKSAIERREIDADSGRALLERLRRAVAIKLQLPADLRHRVLTVEEQTLLMHYAQQRGARWKGQLREDWLYARLQGPLHALRNSHGESWLRGYTAPRG